MRTRGRQITFGGRTQTVAKWAEEAGVSPLTMSRRLKKWPLEKALTEPKTVGCSDNAKKEISAARSMQITFGGVTRSAKEWARKLGITSGALHARLQRWPLAKAMTTPNQRNIDHE